MAGQSLDQIRTKLREELPFLRAEFGVTGLWIFGSRSRREQSPQSDVDVLVDFDGRPMGLFKFMELELLLTDRLGIQVDLVQRTALRSELRESVLPQAVPV